MPIVTVGQMIVEETRLNKGGEDRWVKGTIRVDSRCYRILSEIGQKKLPFTIVTGQVLPKEPVILMGELDYYPIPNSPIIWKTLRVERFITRDAQLLKDLNVDFQTAVRKIAAKDKPFLKALGATKLEIRKRITDLVGIKNKFADHLIELFHDRAYAELVENPWKMIHLIPYFTIAQADKVAQKLGIPLTDKRRFQEYFRYLLDQSFENHRNTYITENEFLAFYWMHFSNDMSLEEFKQLARTKDSPIWKTELGYHPTHLYYAERASYEIVMKSLDITIPITKEEERVTDTVLTNSPITLTGEQIHAVKHAFHTPLHIITGGPGTGKTTVLQTILTKLMLLTGSSPDSEYAPFLLVAPTGKAAYRMWEQTGVTAHTIHSAFGIIPEYGCLDVKETAKRLSHIRYLIIDESSMLDTKLFGDMCRVLLEMNHIPFLLLVGDADQLPPVQHGQVFQDLLQFLSKAAPNHVTELTILKRQDNGSSVPELAAYIKQGMFPDKEWFDKRSDIFFVPVTMDNFQATLMQNVLIPKKECLETVQILTPYRNGGTPDTIHAINKLTAPLYNPVENKDAPSITAGKIPQVFHIGDKVINRANYSKTIINGSVGYITNINNGPRDVFAWTMDVAFEGEIRTYIYEEFKTLELAYAITIHASQGSEYENVVTCMLRGSNNSEFLNRNLLYVAVTRAKNRLVLMGQEQAFRQVAQTEQKLRKTALAHWLSNCEERM